MGPTEARLCSSEITEEILVKVLERLRDDKADEAE